MKLGVNAQRTLLGMLIGAVIGAFFAYARVNRLDALERWELNFVDWRYRIFKAPENVSDDIVVVEFTERTLDKLYARGTILGVHRSPYAELVETLRILGARAIAIDVTFKSRSPRTTFDEDPLQASEQWGMFGAQDREFGAALATAGNVVIAVDATDCEPLERDDWKACQLHHGQLRRLVPFFENRVLPVTGDVPHEFSAKTATQKVYVDFPDGTVLPFTRAVGFVNVRHTHQHDSTIRKFTPISKVDAWKIPDFGVAAFAVAHTRPASGFVWDQEALPATDAFEPLPAARIGDQTIEISSRAIPIDDEGFAWIHWRGDWLTSSDLTSKKHDAWSILQNYDALYFGELDKVEGLDLDAFKNKIVLVGYTAQGEHADNVTTPFGAQPGVFRHAAVVDTVLQGKWLRSPTRSIEALLTLLVGTLAGALVLGIPLFRWQEVEGPVGPFVMALWKFAPGGILMATYALAMVYAFGRGWVVSLLHPELAMVLTTTLATSLAYVFTRGEREEARRTSEQALALAKRTLPGAIVDEAMAKEGRVNLGGERFNLTVYFSDIAGFTSISERMSPEELVSVLNEYLTRVTERLVGQGAIIDKYIGDAVMAFWGAPLKVSDGPVRSCLAALEAIEVIDRYSNELVARGLTPLKTRIGINTGPAIAGGVGHLEHRYSYTAMGDTVNLASRLEGANKAYGTTCMLGPETYENAKEAVLARELDLVRVKGKKIPVRVYELMGRAADPLPEKRAIKARYESALALYRARKFQEARAVFSELAAKGDPPSAAMVENCEERIASPPPEDWDGSNELHEK